MEVGSVSVQPQQGALQSVTVHLQGFRSDSISVPLQCRRVRGSYSGIAHPLLSITGTPLLLRTGSRGPSWEPERERQREFHDTSPVKSLGKQGEG